MASWHSGQIDDTPLLSRRAALASTLGFLQLLSGAQATPSPCDAGLPQLRDDPFGYREREGRCEGVYAREVSAGLLRVASFHTSYEDYDLSQPKPLHLRWPRPPGNAPVQLRAQALRPRLHYRMDALAAAGSNEFVWPIGVLAGLGAGKPDVGVRASTPIDVAGESRTLLLPLRLSQRRPEQQGDPTVLLMCEIELSEVFVTLSPYDRQGRAGAASRTDAALGYGYYPPERPIAVPLTGLSPSTVHRLRIGATLRDGASSTLDAWLLSPP